MEKNTNSTIEEPKICKICMTFYANPKLGTFCSKCFNEQNKADSKKEENVSKESEKKEISPPEEQKEEIIEKEEKPIQVNFIFHYFLNFHFIIFKFF